MFTIELDDGREAPLKLSYKYCMTRQKMKKNHKITIHLNLSNIKIKESNYLLKIPPKVRL